MILFFFLDDRRADLSSGELLLTWNDVLILCKNILMAETKEHQLNHNPETKLFPVFPQNIFYFLSDRHRIEPFPKFT
jgi:hypothetical protein